MRILILSDIHSNLTAFKAVLGDAGSFERTICLGDLVGYGPDPDACVKLLRELPQLTCILGNHDAAMLDFISTSRFNAEARKALNQQRTMLSRKSLDFLSRLPEKVVLDDITLAHGSPRDLIWEYVDSGRTAWEVFEHFETQGCLVGHTHTPCIFIESEDNRMSLLKPNNRDRWIPDNRFILNPGSVGQPRDHDPRASYVIWDTEENSWLFRRVAYDIESVASRIEKQGMPLLQARRLRLGR